ncbi:MAG: leucine-rich repeat protein, partial [Alistipes sp.]|nr:leucine-rich repeat protein [Alistipes sp.]
DGSVDNEVPVTFKAAAPATQTTSERLSVNNNSADYYWLAMNYILVPEYESSLAKCDLTVEIPGQVPVKVSVPMAPAKRNWRTNLVGQLLTEQGNLTIEILPIPEGELPNPDDNNLVHELILTAAVGGEITLTEDVVTPHTLVVLSDMTLDLGGKSLAIDNTTRSAQTSDPVIQVKKGAKLIVKNGTIKSEVVNGGANIYNEGTVILMDGTNLVGAPIGGEEGYPSYCIRNAGNLTIEEGVTVSADRGCLFLSGEGETVINGGTLRNNDISDKRESFTSHVIVVGYGANNKLTINGGTFNHLHTKTSGGVVVNNWSAVTVDINGGDFRGGNYFGKWDNLSDYGYGSTKTPFCVKGGSFSGFDNKFLAAGYKAVLVDNLYYVLPEVVADAATAANVTAVTESTADVATALATDNSEATLFTWNDVAYIAKYGEVVITSAAEEATTVRGIVESAAALKSATVAEGIEVVGNRTFRKCAALETVTFPNSLTEIGSAVFQSCSKLANVTIPASVTTIGEGAFAECTSLTTINIPDGVTRLEKDVLRATGLTSIVIPASVTYIGHYAFRDCDQLTEVKILAPEFTIENNSFTNMTAPVPTMTIYVVNAEMKAYLDSTLTNYDKSYITVVVL